MAKYIYLINILEQLKELPASLLLIFAFALMILAAISIFESEKTNELFFDIYIENIKKYRRAIKKSLIAIVISIALSIAIPSREDMYMMFLSNYITLDNYNAVKNEIKESIDYLSDKFDKQK